MERRADLWHPRNGGCVLSRPPSTRQATAISAKSKASRFSKCSKKVVLGIAGDVRCGVTQVFLWTEGSREHRCKLKKLYLKVPAGRIADIDKSQLCSEFKPRMKNGAFVNGVTNEKG
jgi:hypothetical protein